MKQMHYYKELKVDKISYKKINKMIQKGKL